MPPKDKPLECVQEEGEILYLVSSVGIRKYLKKSFGYFEIRHFSSATGRTITHGAFQLLELSPQFSANKEVAKQRDMNLGGVVYQAPNITKPS